MALFWDVVRGGHSVALLSLSFSISLINCCSNVLCLPWMGRFRSQRHLILYLVGMSLSGFLPSLLALVQGASSVQCRNGTNGTTQAFFPPPLFPPRTFFLLIAALVAAALLAFVAVLLWPFAQQRREDDFAAAKREGGRMAGSRDALGLLLLIGWICALMDTILPSLQSYAAVPYGLLAWHGIVVGTGLASPVGSLLAFCPLPRRAVYVILAVVATAVTLGSAWLIAQASLSPSPPLAR